MPPASSAAAGPDPTPTDTAIAAGTDTTGVAVDQPPADPGVDADYGDGAVYNVIQTVDVASASGDFKIYVVQGGDSLNKIGARFGLSRNTVYWANPTRLPNPASIRVGLKLLIPPADGVTVTVRSGNTLSGFASKYKVSVQKIMASNAMTDTSVTVGQLLLIPTAQVPAIPTPKPAGGPGGGIAWHGGKLRWPVPSSRTITQYFSSSRHPALDIGANTGAPVVAAYGGKVIFAGWKYSGSAGYGGGLVVWISHGGKLWTTYNHLSAEFVRVGQVVSAGQVIGHVGMTGNATGPHLHFEVWACYPWTGGGTACARNPLRYF
jgi:murein DD-endopeptidase MepM/ murein hydrolase activator NlpD